MHTKLYNIFRLSLLLVLFFQTAVIQAATIESAATGNWNAAATWAGGVIPAAGDDVVIKNGHTVTLSDTRSCITLTVETGAILALTGALNNSGVFLNQGTVGWSGALTGAGNFTNDGILNIDGFTNHNTAANITNNAGGTINWINGNLDAGGGGQILTNNGIFNLIGNNPSNLTCSMPIVNAGTINKTTGTLIIVQTFDNQATGTVNVSAGAILNFGTSNNLNQSGAFIVDGTLSLGSNLTQSQVFTINGTANVGNLLTFGAGGGFSGTGTVNITGSAPTFNAGSTLTTKLNITGGTLNDNVGLTPGEVTFNGVLGAYSGTGSPSFANGFIWNAGSFSGSGTVTISGGMSVNGASGHSISGDKQLHLSGTGTVNNGALLSFSGTAKFIVTSTGAVTFDGASNASASGGATNLFEIQSGGALIKSGAGIYSLQLPFSENGGSITVDGGTLRFGSSTQSFTNGTAVLNASTSLIFSSSTATMTGTAVSGDGTLRLEVSTLNANTGTTITSKLYVFTGTLNDNVGLQPGEVTLGSVAQGFYGGTGSPSFANGFIWNLGDILGSGIVTVSGSLTATSTLSPMRISNTKELHITGTATFTGTGFSMIDNSKFIVKSGGSVGFHVPGSNVSVGGSVNTLFDIQSGGTMTKTGAGNLVASTAFSNAGTVSIETGTLDLSSTFTNTGAIKGTGTLDLGATNTNTGTFAPGLSPGTLGVVGNYVNSTLDIEIEAGPPVAKDLLNVTGNITLTGSTLNVSEMQCLPNGSYDIISYTGTRTGSFATVNAPAAYTVSYDDAAKKVRLDYLDGVPTIVCPDDVSVNTDAGICTASGVALGTPTGTDNCAGVIYSNDAGTFPIGVSRVIWTATDIIGQTATCEQTVTVSDAEPPVITCPENQTITVNAVCSGTLGTWTPISLSDNCTTSEAIIVTQNPDAATTLYGPGDAETVTLTADDGNGNTNYCSFTVTLNITSLPSETCNGVDDDCDGLIDDADPNVTGRPTWYADADGDGYGDAAVSQPACSQPAGYVSDNTDCNDSDWFINPAAEEVCNGMDDDCDGLIDDDDPSVDGQITWYADADGDGYGTTANYQVSCDKPAGFVANNNDCDDTDAGINPGMTEACNGIDDDCDGLSDEGCGNPLTVDAGICQVVYYGYVPLSCTTLTAYASGGIPGYSFTWSNGMTGASIQVCPIAGQSYTVTVTDGSNNMATDAVAVEVIDVRCGNNNKVLLCHNGSNTLCISPNAVPDHLAHGDYLGTCGNEPCASGNNSIMVSKPPVAHTTASETRISCYPNPTDQEINVLITGHKQETGIVEIADATGNIIRRIRKEVSPGEPFRVDLAGLPAGAYSLLWKTQGWVLATRFIVARP